ncbi:MAG TPA: type IV secretory system conjugative DNA transfer family protein, partial [Terriglobales bacterium]|nr:type IV secretory system conjugative DNA transfer family protein [Terriglobales bacterium]
ILKARWNLDSFGARTEELLRNGLHVLADNGLTLLELSPLLTSAAFRAGCLNRVQNTEVISYFQTRFDTRSEAMQGIYRDAILNKISGFTADLRLRHILGQQRSTFSLLDAMDRGQWVILNLDKGRLGEQASTLGSLLLTKLKNALFARRRRQLFTIYADEIQNLVAYDAGLDTLLSEARKFGISVVSANQFLEQYPAQMRAAIMAVGTHVFFQLSSTDADRIGSALDGGKRLSELLKNLPKRHMVVKSGSHRPREVLVPNVAQPEADYADLYNRCRARWARRRTDIEAEIRQRHQDANRGTEEALNDWE